MISSNPGILISFAAYLLVMIAIGWYFYRRTKNVNDYFLGNRGLNKWVTSLSAQASDMSGWLLLGLPGYAYLAGMESFWLALGLITGTWLNWKLVARRLRIYTEVAGNAITLPEYFANRFDRKGHTLRMLAAVFILIFFLIYTASGFVAGAKLFNTVFGLSYQWALTTGVLVIIIYTFLGGFMAVSWTDFLQGIIMFLAIISVPVLAIMFLEGPGATLGSLQAQHPELLSIYTNTKGEPISTITILSSLAWGLGYFGQPHILARFMAIKSPHMLKGARRIAVTWSGISLACAILIGLFGNLVVQEPLTETSSETIFMYSVDVLVPPLLAGVVLSAILAAIMSTADSQLLVSSSAFSEDFYKSVLNPKASPRKLVIISRLTVVGVALVAFLIALDPQSSVLDLVSYAWGGFGATFGPLVLLSLFWKRMTYRGAIGGILAGGLTVIIWKPIQGGIFDLYEILPGFIISVFTIVIVSLFDQKPSEEVIGKFAEAHKT